MIQYGRNTDHSRVPTVEPDIYFDEPADKEPNTAALNAAVGMTQESLRYVLQIVSEGPAKSTAARLAAVRYFFNHFGAKRPSIAKLARRGRHFDGQHASAHQVGHAEAEWNARGKMQKN